MVHSGCSLETFDGVFCLLIGNIVWGGVFTLEVVWRLFFCFNVRDYSLVIILIVWVVSSYFWEISEFPTVVALLAWGFAFLFCSVGPWATASACSLSTVPVVSLGPDSSHSTPVAGSPTSNWASVAPSAPEVWPGVHLWELGYLVYWCTVCAVCRLWLECLDLSVCCILFLTYSDAFIECEAGAFWDTLLVSFCAWESSHNWISD